MKTAKLTYRQFNNINTQKFNELLFGISWSQVLDEADTDKAFDLFHNILGAIFEKCFPSKTVIIS